MNKFSIKIDLSTFFEDERKMVLLMVDPIAMASVSCLQERVQKLFEVDEVRFINNDEVACFLPPQEPIEIVRFCKELKAFIPKESLDKRKRKKSKKDKTIRDESSEEAVDIPACIEESNDATKKKRKYRSLESGCFASSTPNNAKRLKNFSGNNTTTSTHHQKQINKSSEISSTSEQMPPPLSSVPITTSKPGKISKAKKSSNVSSATVVANDSYDEDTVSAKNDSSTDEAYTESSMRKQKISNLSEGKSIEMSSLPPRLNSLPSSTFINESKKSQKSKRSSKNPFKNQSPNLKHIHFDESGEISTTTKKNTLNKENNDPAPAKPIIFQCPLNEIDTKTPRIFQIRRSDIATGTSNKPVIEIQENIILKPVVVAPNCYEAMQTKKSNDDLEINVVKVGNAPEESVIKDNSNLEESVAKDDNRTQQEDESFADEGNSSLNDTAANTSASTTINKSSRKSADESQLLPVNQTTNTTGACEQSQEDDDDVSVNQTTNIDDESVKDENESSIVSVDCVDLSVDLDEEDESKYKSKPRKSRNSKFQRIASISDTSDIEEVIDLNESEEQHSTHTSSFNVPNNSYTGFKINRIISLCTDAKELPDVGDIMIFKIPFNNRQGNPDCTKFLAGRIERIQHRTKLIRFLILDGHTELCYVPCKHLDNFVDNSMSEEKYVQIKFSEMIQPRLLPKNKRSLF